MLYLEWEAKYPEDWTHYANGTKAKLTDLVVSAVECPYRCEDRRYARLARAIDNDGLRARLGHAAQSNSPWARYQASFVLWLLTNPEAPASRHTWRMCLATRNTPAPPQSSA